MHSLNFLNYFPNIPKKIQYLTAKILKQNTEWEKGHTLFPFPALSIRFLLTIALWSGYGYIFWDLFSNRLLNLASQYSAPHFAVNCTVFFLNSLARLNVSFWLISTKLNWVNKNAKRLSYLEPCFPSCVSSNDHKALESLK